MIDRHENRWGIIGDGQLARMLTLSAYPLGIRPVVLTSDALSSAGQVCPLQVRGSVQSRTDLHMLLSQVDFAIIESEFVNCDALESTSLAHKVVPGINVIRVLQNKLEQKKLLKRLGISTSPFYEQTGINSLWLNDLFADKHPRVVLKFATLGYDGKGVCILGKDVTDRERAAAFLELANERKIEVYAEDRVDFAMEVAMIAVRSANGSFTTYPLVVSEQANGICNRVEGPATSLGVDPHLEVTARKWCEKIASELQIVGTFAIEFFVTKGGSLLVNEIAPRVHNTGHYTQDAGCVSQFENHWRAVTGMTLGSTKTKPYFSMQNILGPPGILSKESTPIPKVSDHTTVHWYHKAGVSPGRKLGHLNASGDSFDHRQLINNACAKSLAEWTAVTRERIPPTNLELPR